SARKATDTSCPSNSSSCCMSSTVSRLSSTTSTLSFSICCRLSGDVFGAFEVARQRQPHRDAASRGPSPRQWTSTFSSWVSIEPLTSDNPKLKRSRPPNTDQNTEQRQASPGRCHLLISLSALAEYAGCAVA